MISTARLGLTLRDTGRVSTARLGLTLRDTGRLYLGRWADIFDAYKKQYNFEIRRGLYLLEEEPASLDVL